MGFWPKGLNAVNVFIFFFKKVGWCYRDVSA